VRGTGGVWRAAARWQGRRNPVSLEGMPASRSGFTLIEMLVATIVFLVGFVATFGLFLTGMRYRQIAEDTTKAALTSTSIISEIRLDAGRPPVDATGPAAPEPPHRYIGSGFADIPDPYATPLSVSTPRTTPLDAPLYAYDLIPGMWYRVLDCTDLVSANGDDPMTPTLNMTVLVVPYATGATTLTMQTLFTHLLTHVEQQQLSASSGGVTSEQVAAALVNHGIAFIYRTVIVRHPSWMP
jgi:prepilin-type N-terminal cleavage/methylation domain-containing protein